MSEKLQAAGAQIEIEGTKMVITVELDPNAPLSSSGKSKLMYSSHGWVALGNGMKMNVGVIEPLKRR